MPKPISKDKNTFYVKNYNFKTKNDLNSHNSNNFTSLSDRNTNSVPYYENLNLSASEITEKLTAELFNYYKSGFRAEENFVISAFTSQIFSGPLCRIAELAIDENFKPNSNEFWESFKRNFVIPEVYVNGEKVSALIDTGASCSAISLKFSQIEAIRSLKLVFTANAREIKLANDQEIDSHGKLVNVPVMINKIKTTTNPHIMEDLSYDLILGRDWCEANGVVLDFNKKKIYLLKSKSNYESLGLMDHFDEKPLDLVDPTKFEQPNQSIYKFKLSKFAQLEHQICLKPYHEALVSVRSDQNNSDLLFIKNHNPLVGRFGIFATKGIIKFNDNLAFLTLANLTPQDVILPEGTIVAKLEDFNEEDYFIHEWSYENQDNVKLRNRFPVKRKFIIREDDPNKYCNWRPMAKNKQSLVIDESRKLVNVIDCEVNGLEDENTRKKVNEKIKEPYTKAI